MLVSFITNLASLLKKVDIGRYPDYGIVNQAHFSSRRLNATNSVDRGTFMCICSRPRSMHAWAR